MASQVCVFLDAQPFRQVHIHLGEQLCWGVLSALLVPFGIVIVVMLVVWGVCALMVVSAQLGTCQLSFPFSLSLVSNHQTKNVSSIQQ